MKRTLLLAEDEEITLSLLRKVFSGADLQILEAHNGEEAIRILEQHPVDVVLTDIKMPVADGLDVLAHVRRNFPGVEVILMTGFGSVESAVHAMKMGAFHYVTKPFNVEEVVHLVNRVFELTEARKENAQLKFLVRDLSGIEKIIGNSVPIQQVLSLVRKVADTDSTILVVGESGTGKELIARAIHYLSPRAERMLVPINCSAIPPDLLESELFGHVKGAFTGAIATRIGRFEMAHNGTIFLDEIGEMSPHLQAKLLRVLQERAFIPVGGTKTVNVDTRVIAATNKNLEEEVREGRFRADLFFRLNVIPIRIPPLRERTDDIPVLARHFIEKFNSEKSRSIEGIRPDALKILAGYAWPGNIRELENLIERITVLKGTGWIEPEDLPEMMFGDGRTRSAASPVLSEGGMDIKSATENFENELIQQAMKMAKGNKNRAASLLGLKRTTFVEMLKRKNFAVQDTSNT